MIPSTGNTVTFLHIADNEHKRLIERAGAGSSIVAGHWDVPKFSHNVPGAACLSLVPLAQRYICHRTQDGNIFSLCFAKNSCLDKFVS